jgi:hypothetical protein
MQRFMSVFIVFLVGLLTLSGGPFTVRSADMPHRFELNSSYAEAQDLSAVSLPLLTVRSAGLPQRLEPSDSEPNSSCVEAQDLGAVSLPLRLTGSITPPAESEPDSSPVSDGIDFFRLSVAPAMQLLIELRGEPSGLGTLPDPLLGVFDSSCTLIASLDDSYSGLEPELLFTVPDDGVLVIAATAFADFTFTGSGYSGGSYRLSVQEANLIQGISGSLVDSATNTAPPDQLWLELQRCDEETGCRPVQHATLLEGSFSFYNDPYQPLQAGSYQIQVQSDLYQSLTIGPFTVARDELKILDPVLLQRLPVIGSISGQVVNALDNQPIPSNAYVRLTRCQDGNCWYDIGALSTDGEGRFRFDEASFGRPLTVGEYQLMVYSDQFESRTFDPFTVSEGEHRELGPLPLQPNPLQFFDPQGCQEIPAQGGMCHYSIEIVNNQLEAAQLKVWSVIFVQSPIYGAFQPEGAFTLRLDPGQGRVVSFSLDVPANVPDFTSFCGGVYVADATPGFYLQPRLSRFVFCSLKGADGVFRMLPEPAARELSRRLQAEPAVSPMQPQKQLKEDPNLTR